MKKKKKATRRKKDSLEYTDQDLEEIYDRVVAKRIAKENKRLQELRSAEKQAAWFMYFLYVALMGLTIERSGTANKNPVVYYPYE